MSLRAPRSSRVFGAVHCSILALAACTGAGENGETAGDTGGTTAQADTGGSAPTTASEPTGADEGTAGGTVDGSGGGSDAEDTAGSSADGTTEGGGTADDGSTGAQPDACGSEPVIAYDVDFSTYLGGAADWEHARDVFVEPNGNVVVVGGTASNNFPATAGAYDTTFNAGGNATGPHGDSDVFVAKFGPDGTLLWATYLGGPNYDRAYAVEVGDNGDIYVSGRSGPGFPVTAGVFQPEYLGNDSGFYGVQNGFLAKFSGDGGELIWASQVGVAHLVRDFDIDDAGDAYVVLAHQSGSVSTAPGWFAGAFDNAYQPTRNDAEESGLAKISADGTQVLWATWLGGHGADSSIGSVRVDEDHQPYLAFYTDSDDLPTTAADTGAALAGGTDVYVARLSDDGANLQMGAYFGGSGDDAFETHGLGLGDGHVYVGGFSSSTDLPVTPGALQTTLGGTLDAFVAKLDLTGNLVAATYVGGSGADSTDGLSVTAGGQVLFSGETNSDDLPVTANAFQSARGGDWDAFAIRLDADLGVLRYGSYFGGPAHDNGRGALINEDCSVMIVGASAGAGFPAVNAWQAGFAGGGEQWGNGDAVVVSLSVGG